jgi:16S rRNA (guanine(966)-N(2))-methyltransferase RsmD
MRVIAGEAKGRRLRAVPGDTTRPITDRAKEALFDILADRVRGARVLDLFAGTGSVGIEALSRGAAECDFVELAAAALATIRSNLEVTGLGERARLIRQDVLKFLRRAPSGPYDLVFVAPPQYRGLWLEAVRALDAQPDWLCRHGVVVVQIHPVEDQSVETQRLARYDARRYGSVLLLFFAAQDGA